MTSKSCKILHEAHVHEHWWLQRPVHPRLHHAMPCQEKTSFSDIMKMLQERHSDLPSHRKRLFEQDLDCLASVPSPGVNDIATAASRRWPKGSTSTKRDPPAFEYVGREGQELPKRRCGACQQEGHNRRTCPQPKITKHICNNLGVWRYGFLI